MKRFLPYYRYLKPVLKPFIAAIVLGLIYGASSGFGLPMMIHYVFPKIFTETDTTLPIWNLVVYALLLPVAFLIRGLSGFFNTYLIAYSGAKVLAAIRLDVFRKIQALQLDFFAKHKTGDLLTRLNDDANKLKIIITDLSNKIIREPVTLISAMGALVYLSFKNNELIFILFCLSSIPICVFTIRKIGKKLLKRTRESMKLIGEINNILAENLLATKDIRAFCLEAVQTQKLDDCIKKNIRLQMKVVKYSRFLTPLVEIISAVGVAFTLVIAYQRGIGLDIFIPLVSALYFSYNPIKGIGEIHNEIKSGQASLERLEYILHMSETIRDPDIPTETKRFKGDVAFNDISFAYIQEPTLTKVRFSAKAGETLALVGPSGAGKTTIANLLLRFYDPDQGNITIDGIPIKTLRKADLRKHIAFVPQDPFLFNDTIYNNILYGKLDATEAQVYTAARNAYAETFILEQPDGYQTIIGDRGSSLSGGQKQRLAIARAFLRDAPILILDEATSALDAESETFVQRALEQLIQNRTVFIIAHRFSTIRFADNILVFDKGRLIASGLHETLYDNCATYKTLYDSQKFE